jgi:hypothetical protein
MKRRITIDQLNELSEEQKQRLSDWWSPNKGDWYYYPAINHIDVIETSLAIDLNLIRYDHYPLLDIGQMIELLFDCRITDKYFSHSLIVRVSKYGSDIYGNERNFEDGINESKADELADALWKAVKSIL